jgi:hypothetical protein
MAQPDQVAREAAPVKSSLRPAATFSTSWEVVSRQWLALFLLQLLLGLLPDIGMWIYYGFSPTYIDLIPHGAREAYIAFGFVVGALYGYMVARITLVDQLEGRRLTFRDAVRVPPRIIPGLLLATLLISLPAMAINAFTDIGMLPTPWYLTASIATTLMGSVILAFVGPTSAIIVDEGVSGVPAVLRAIQVTSGRRIALTITIFAFDVVWFLIQWGLGRLISLWLVLEPEAADRFWRGVSWEALDCLQGVLWPVWMTVLYVALRRAREGVASASDIALFE